MAAALARCEAALLWYSHSFQAFTPHFQALEGVKMELRHCSYDLLEDVVVTAETTVVFKEIDILI